VAPEVTTGRVVVVVGGKVVVVVVVVAGGAVVVVAAAEFDEPPGSDVVVVGGDVVEVVEVVEVVGVEVVGTCAGAVLDSLPPGCSFATTTPMAIVAPVAARTAKRVRKRRWELVRRLVSGECGRRGDLIDDLRSAPIHGRSSARCLSGIRPPNIRPPDIRAVPRVRSQRHPASGPCTPAGSSVARIRLWTRFHRTEGALRQHEATGNIRLHLPLRRHVPVMVCG
jgi:hypothetical protein